MSTADKIAAAIEQAVEQVARYHVQKILREERAKRRKRMKKISPDARRLYRWIEENGPVPASLMLAMDWRHLSALVMRGWVQRSGGKLMVVNDAPTWE